MDRYYIARMPTAGLEMLAEHPEINPLLAIMAESEIQARYNNFKHGR